MGHAERRGEAALQPDGRGIRRLPVLHRRPNRPDARLSRRSGQLDNTIIVVISDNGASGEGGPNGSVNENKFFNGYIDTAEESMRFYDELGGPETYNHYPIGWAMAFNTPYKLFKRYASHEGGIADTAIVSWPNGIDATARSATTTSTSATSRPTIYDLLDITPPDQVAESRRSRSTA